MASISPAACAAATTISAVLIAILCLLVSRPLPLLMAISMMISASCSHHLAASSLSMGYAPALINCQSA